MGKMETKSKLIHEAEKYLGEFKLSETYLTAGSVASALITKNGNIYTGICLDLASGIGFCAEHSAISEMLKNRETEIEMIVAISKNGILPPCGRCRELMLQVDTRNKGTKVIIDEDKMVTLGELLPYPWE